VSRIRALLVGIDEYERPDIPSLRGCVNDVALVRLLLKRYLGVPNEDIRVVVNQRATKENILRRLAATIERAAPGDVVVFYFSGHGSQIRDRDGDELDDGLDELLCPYDMDWDRRTYLIDDDLDAMFRAIPPDVLLEAFFDCCFWGAGPRELLPEPRPQSLRTDVRYLPPPFDIAARVEGDEHRVDVHHLVACESFSGRNVLWAASREGQAAAEDYIEGRANGIFTYWGCQFIAEHIEKIDRTAYSRERLLEDLRAYLHSLGYAQTPELSAASDLRTSAPLALPPGWREWGDTAPASSGAPPWTRPWS
jgi:metacaspase-1